TRIQYVLGRESHHVKAFKQPRAHLAADGSRRIIACRRAGKVAADLLLVEPLRIGHVQVGRQWWAGGGAKLRRRISHPASRRNMLTRLADTLRGAAERLALPQRCLFCAAPRPHEGICDECRKELPGRWGERCPVCANLSAAREVCGN